MKKSFETPEIEVIKISNIASVILASGGAEAGDPESTGGGGDANPSRGGRS